MNLHGLREIAIGFFEKALFLGVFLVLAGMVLLPSSSRYHTLYYLLVLAPTVFMLLLKPKLVAINFSAIFFFFILFLSWATLSIFWSDSDENILFPLTRSLYTFCLFMAFAVVMRESRDVFLKILIVAGFVITVVSFYYFLGFLKGYRSGQRFIGGGALSNPLLSSHLFGFFTVIFTVLVFLSQSWQPRLLYLLFALTLFVFVVATGSRTPLAALVAAFVWVVVVQRNRKAISMLGCLMVALLGVLLFYPEAILSRGLSFRPDLWGMTIDKIIERPFLGYGIDADAGFYLGARDTLYREPHNMHLSVFYFAGVVGFLLWCCMHIYALWSCWKEKNNKMYLIGGTLLVYGAAAGMFEGGWLLPRINEHWFITWIPLAFISALLARDRVSLNEEVSLRRV